MVRTHERWDGELGAPGWKHGDRAVSLWRSEHDCRNGKVGRWLYSIEHDNFGLRCDRGGIARDQRHVRERLQRAFDKEALRVCCRDQLNVELAPLTDGGEESIICRQMIFARCVDEAQLDLVARTNIEPNSARR